MSSFNRSLEKSRENHSIFMREVLGRRQYNLILNENEANSSIQTILLYLDSTNLSSTSSSSQPFTSNSSSSSLFPVNLPINSNPNISSRSSSPSFSRFSSNNDNSFVTSNISSTQLPILNSPISSTLSSPTSSISTPTSTTSTPSSTSSVTYSNSLSSSSSNVRPKKALAAVRSPQIDKMLDTMRKSPRRTGSLSPSKSLKNLNLLNNNEKRGAILDEDLYPSNSSFTPSSVSNSKNLFDKNDIIIENSNSNSNSINNSLIENQNNNSKSIYSLKSILFPTSLPPSAPPIPPSQANTSHPHPPYINPSCQFIRLAEISNDNNNQIQLPSNIELKTIHTSHCKSLKNFLKNNKKKK